MNLTRMSSRPLGFCVAALLSASALADLPPAMNHVPRNAAVAVSVTDVGAVVDGVERMLGAFGGMGGGGDMLEVFGAIRGLAGLDSSGSAAAAVIFPPDFDPEGGAEPDALLILPVSDYAQLAEGLGGNAQGLSEVFIQGQTAYLKSLGRGFAVACSTREMAERFEPGDAAGAFESLMGQAGADLADRSQFVAVINMEPLAPMVGALGARMQQNLGPQMMAIPGVDQIVADLFRRLESDGQSATIGLQFADTGVSLGAAAQFKSGSETAGSFESGGTATELLGRLPDQPFFFAMAVDSRNKLFQQLGDFMQQMRKMQAEMMGMPAAEGSILEHTSGYSYIVGNPPGGIMGGLFAATTGYYRSEDVGELRTAVKDATSKLAAQDVPGVEMSGSYSENVLQVSGVDVDTWSVSVALDPNNPNAAQAQMAINMLAGGPGFGGMVAPIDGGAVMTMSKNPELLSSAIEAARGGNGLSNNASIRSVSEFLPRSRSFELYIGTQDLVQTALQMMQMFGGAPPIQMPENLQPIAVGMGGRGGAAEIGWFISSDTIDFIAQLGQTFGNMGAGVQDDF